MTQLEVNDGDVQVTAINGVAVNARRLSAGLDVEFVYTGGVNDASDPVTLLTDLTSETPETLNQIITDAAETFEGDLPSIQVDAVSAIDYTEETQTITIEVTFPPPEP